MECRGSLHQTERAWHIFREHVYLQEHVCSCSNPAHRLMGNSVFCLVPRGRAAWSVRFFEVGGGQLHFQAPWVVCRFLFEALWAGCVPVLLSDLQACSLYLHSSGSVILDSNTRSTRTVASAAREASPTCLAVPGSLPAFVRPAL